MFFNQGAQTPQPTIFTNPSTTSFLGGSNNVIGQNQNPQQNLGINSGQNPNPLLGQSNQTPQPTIFNNPPTPSYLEGNVYFAKNQIPQQNLGQIPNNQFGNLGQNPNMGGNLGFNNQNYQGATNSNVMGQPQNLTFLQNQGVGNKDFSLTGQHDGELQNVFTNFLNAMNISNPNCLFKTPVYDEIPNNMSPFYFATHTYIPDMDPFVWDEKFKANPNPNKFFVNHVKGVEELSRRYQGRIEVFHHLGNQMRINQQKIDELKNISESIIKAKIKKIKEKNGILLDKILLVHNLIEKISLKYNEFEKSTNDEIVLIKNLSNMENLASQETAKVFEMKMSLMDHTNLERNKPANEMNKSTLTKTQIENQKKKKIEILEKMKVGIEILQNFNQKDIQELKILKGFIENNKFLK